MTDTPNATSDTLSVPAGAWPFWQITDDPTAPEGGVVKRLYPHEPDLYEPSEEYWALVEAEVALIAACDNAGCGCLIDDTAADFRDCPVSRASAAGGSVQE